MRAYLQAMPFTVLRVSKGATGQTDVLGEFSTETEAAEFAEAERGSELGGDYDFSVESPPASQEPTLWR